MLLPREGGSEGLKVFLQRMHQDAKKRSQRRHEFEEKIADAMKIFEGVKKVGARRKKRPSTAGKAMCREETSDSSDD